MGNDLEKAYDDLVYEDDFYAENFTEGEDVVSEEEIDDQSGEIVEDMEIILVCEECSNQWEEVVAESESSSGFFCPMCGSDRIMQI